MSSSSDEDVQPVIKKQRSTRSTMSRGVIDDLDNSADTFDYQYSNIVSRHWGKTLPQAFNASLSPPLSLKTSSLITSSCQVPTTTSQSISSVYLESKQGHSEVSSCSIVEHTKKIKEPTPPSSPVNQRLGHRSKKRLKKGVKKAMMTLANLQNVLQYNDDLVSSHQHVMRSEVSEGVELSKITVKVRCPSGLRRYQFKPSECFAHLISDIARLEDVVESKVVMFLNDKTVHSYDTPKSIALTVTDFIECHIQHDDTTADPTQQLHDDSSLDMHLTLHLQYENKTKTTLCMRKDEPMQKLMQEFCKLRDINVVSVMFQFDGEVIDLSATPADLEIETDYCIDVIERKTLETIII